jgi:hypothetical protein
MDNLKDAFIVEITIALNSLINRPNYKDLDSKSKKKIIKKVLKHIINDKIKTDA